MIILLLLSWSSYVSQKQSQSITDFNSEAPISMYTTGSRPEDENMELYDIATGEIDKSDEYW